MPVCRAPAPACRRYCSGEQQRRLDGAEQAGAQANVEGAGRAGGGADVEPKGGDARPHKVPRGLGRAVSTASGMVMAVSASIAPVGARRLQSRDMARRPNKAASSALIRWSRRGRTRGSCPAPGSCPAQEGSRESGLAVRPFSLICEIGPAAPLWPLWNPVAVDSAPAAGGARRGVPGGLCSPFRARSAQRRICVRAEGWGSLCSTGRRGPEALLSRHSLYRCGALAVAQEFSRLSQRFGVLSMDRSTKSIPSAISCESSRASTTASQTRC
jgi:hypothetical protein